ncbi:AAA family ATPase [Clostridium beijerinckii]|uniref:AAA family ATPase n=1 Tax=Clostridium beijerinckii TaxID=1520 RepID=UPI00098C7AE0|nr:AAA family ATPase [Clostridium beijerinckii]NRT79872.1 SpoVK/Ycf46/Vps4 family AAA+-type ATPase [Clostridium beijerinckii]OOM38182.1 ATP-dependent zinc metalloprotease FtsH [Clostridium beijerinckii]
MSLENNSTERTKKYLANLFKARFPYVYISTWEEERAISVIDFVGKDENLIKTKRTTYIWSQTDGMCIQGAKGREETKQPIKALEFIEKCEEPAIFILKDFHVFFGVAGRNVDYALIRKTRDLVSVLKNSPRPKSVVFLSPTIVLPSELQKDVTILDFDLPTIDEIKSLLNEMIDMNKQGGRIIIDLDESEKERLCKAALGLTLQEAENAFARAMVEDGRMNIGDLEIILEEKCQVIKKTGILEFEKSNLNMNDVGGLENLKRWVSKRNKSWLDSAQKYNIPAPKGVLITGVPGCGKSLTAKAISAMWQLPLLRLDMGKIFSGIVGSSEENMRKAIKTAEAVAPSILWIDEIEKGFSGASSSSGDSGTSTRIFGTFLTWMQEKTKPVFVVATANNISSLPSELLRKGRFDEIFFVDLPTKNERKDIFRLHLKKRLTNEEVCKYVSITDELLSELADLTEGFVGAEIEQAVVAALFEAFSEERGLQISDLEKVIKNTVPLSVTQAEQIISIREWANVRAVAATAKEDRSEYVKKDNSISSKLGEDTGESKFDDENNSESAIKKARGGRTIDF